MKGRSNFWYLLIFLGIIGGIIGWFVLKRSDKTKARNILIGGGIITLIGFFYNGSIILTYMI